MLSIRLNHRLRSLCLCLLLVLINVVPSSISFAQESGFEGLLPKQDASSIKKQDQGIVNDVSNVVNDSSSTQVLVNAIQGVRLAQWRPHSELLTVKQQDGVTVEVQMLSDRTKVKLRQRLSQEVGQALSLSSLNQLTQSLALMIQRAGYPVVDVFAPAGQNVSQGYIQLLVVPGRTEKVTVKGAKHFDSKRLKKMLNLKQDKIISQQQLTKKFRK